MSAADAPASQKDRTQIVLRLQELGVRDVEDQRHIVAVWTQGRARRRSKLTARDAGSLLARLRERGENELTPADLVRILAMPVPAAPCTECGGPVDERSAADGCPLCLACQEPNMAAQIAEQRATPATLAIDPAACLASWDTAPGELVDVAAADPEILAAVAEYADEQSAKLEPEPAADVPAAATVEPGPAPADSSPGQRPGTRDGDAPGEVADHRPAAPAPPPEVLEPVPEDVEAAAQAAVDRYRERMAAGWVPTAPDPYPMTHRPRVELDIPPFDYSTVRGSKAYVERFGNY